MSRRNAGHFYEGFDRLYKDRNMIREGLKKKYGKEGRWYYHIKYIEQNWSSYLLSLQWTN